MRLFATIIGIAIVVLASSTRADDAAVRKALEARYAELSAAFKKRDANIVASIGTPDFRWKMSTGQTLNAQQAAQRMKGQMASLTTIKAITTRIDKLDVKDKTATVWTTGTFSGTVKGEGGVTHKVVSTGKSKDTWVNKGGKWLIKRVEDISATLTVDGQAVPVGGEGRPPTKK